VVGRVLSEERSNCFRIFLQPCLGVVTNPPINNQPSASQLETIPQSNMSKYDLSMKSPRDGPVRDPGLSESRAPRLSSPEVLHPAT